MTDEPETETHWVVLGNDPTSDKKLIRKAYAGLLKAIDIEKNPDSFIMLRSAYEQALGKLPPPLSDIGSETGVSPKGIVTGPGEDGVEESILSLLGSGASRVDVAPQLARLTENVVARSQSCSLAESEAIEFWLADTIIDGIPRSNAMLAPAIKGFRWDQHVGAHDCPEAVRFIIARHLDLEALYALQRLNPDLEIAWRALTESDVELESVHLGCMAMLLGLAQYRHPHLIDDIDLESFQRWADHLSATRAAERLNHAAMPSELPASRHPLLETVFNLTIVVAGLAVLAGGVSLFVKSHMTFANGWPALALFGVIGGFLIQTGRDRQSRLKR